MAGRSLLLMVVVLFEGGLGKRLKRWRRRSYDDRLDADRIVPHLTLLEPFLAQPPLLPLERHLWAVCHSWPPIWLELGEMARDKSLLYVEVVSGGPDLSRLRDALCTGPLAGQASASGGPARTGGRLAASGGEAAGPFRPRIVVAEPPTQGELAEASERLLGLPVRASYEVKRLHLMAAQPYGSWYVRDFFGLDGTYAASPATNTPSPKAGQPLAQGRAG